MTGEGYAALDLQASRRTHRNQQTAVLKRFPEAGYRLHAVRRTEN